MQEMWVRSLGRKNPLEEEMATHSGVLAWRIPWAGGLESTGLQSQTRLSMLAASSQSIIMEDEKSYDLLSARWRFSQGRKV